MDQSDLAFNIQLDEDSSEKIELKQQTDTKGILNNSKFDLSQAAHPIACVFTLIFKFSALFM